MTLTSFYFVSREIWLGNSKQLICKDQSRFYISSICENSIMFRITSKYFSFFQNKPLASWSAHITRDVLTYYSCSYYSSMLPWVKTQQQTHCVKSFQIRSFFWSVFSRIRISDIWFFGIWCLSLVEATVQNLKLLCLKETDLKSFLMYDIN